MSIERIDVEHFIREWKWPVIIAAVVALILWQLYAAIQKGVSEQPPRTTAKNVLAQHESIMRHGFYVIHTRGTYASTQEHCIDGVVYLPGYGAKYAPGKITPETCRWLP